MGSSEKMVALYQVSTVLLIIYYNTPIWSTKLIGAIELVLWSCGVLHYRTTATTDASAAPAKRAVPSALL
jgi:hypothetical protein